jgi:hypothetical protein
MGAHGVVRLPPDRLVDVRLLDEFGCQDVILTTESLPATPPS